MTIFLSLFSFCSCFWFWLNACCLSHFIMIDFFKFGIQSQISSGIIIKWRHSNLGFFDPPLSSSFILRVSIRSAEFLHGPKRLLPSKWEKLYHLGPSPLSSKNHNICNYFKIPKTTNTPIILSLMYLCQKKTTPSPFFMLTLLRRASFWPPSMAYISFIRTQYITNYEFNEIATDPGIWTTTHRTQHQLNEMLTS